MPIDIKPKKRINIKVPSTFNILFYYSIILILFSFVAYLFVSQWHIEMKNQIVDLEEKMEQIGSSREFQEKKNLVFDKRNIINDYSFLFWERDNVRHMFSFLENLVHPLSHLNQVRISTQEGEVSIEGSTLDFYSLEQQYSILKNFSMEKEFFGWVRARDIKELEDGELLINGQTIDFYRDPVTQSSEIKISEKDKIIMVKKITPADYLLEEARVGRSLISEDWYEVVLTKKIEPIKEVTLSNISERPEDDLKISFTFNILVDTIIFDL